MGTWDGGSQWCNRLPKDRKILEVVGSVLGKGEREGEKEVKNSEADAYGSCASPHCGDDNGC